MAFKLTDLELKYEAQDVPVFKMRKDFLSSIGSLADCVKKKIGDTPLIQFNVIDHNEPTITAMDFIKSFGGREKVDFQSYTAIGNGILASHTDKSPYKEIRRGVCNIQDLDSVKRGAKIPKRPYFQSSLNYDIDKSEMIRNHYLDCLQKWNIPVFSDSTDLLPIINNRQELLGVSSPYFLAGSKGSFFGWHLEDKLLASCLYLLTGYKVWYLVASEHTHLMTKLANKWNTNNPELKPWLHGCKDGLNHRNLFISLRRLEKERIPVKVYLQKPGTCLYISSSVFHAGYNPVPNIGISKNCVDHDWIKFAERGFEDLCENSKHITFESKFKDYELERLKNYQDVISVQVKATIEMCSSLCEEDCPSEELISHDQHKPNRNDIAISFFKLNKSLFAERSEAVNSKKGIKSYNRRKNGTFKKQHESNFMFSIDKIVDLLRNENTLKERQRTIIKIIKEKELIWKNTHSSVFRKLEFKEYRSRIASILNSEFLRVPKKGEKKGCELSESLGNFFIRKYNEMIKKKIKSERKIGI